MVQATSEQTAPLLRALTPGGFEVFGISPFGRVMVDGALESRGPFFADNGMQAFNSVAIQPPFGDTKALNVESPSPANIEVFEVNTKEDTVELKAHLKSGNPTGTTTAIVGSGAGSGTSASLSGNDEHGSITVTTGTATEAEKPLASVKFSSTLAGAPSVILTNGTSSAATAKTYVTAVTGSGFTVTTTNKPKINTTYVYYYSASQ